MEETNPNKMTLEGATHSKEVQRDSCFLFILLYYICMFYITIFDLYPKYIPCLDYGLDINSVDTPEEPTDICSDALVV
jgi:hypothetical protein